MKIHEVSLTELKHIFLVGTHLHKYQGKFKSSVSKIFKSQGSVQYDPLNPAGRYHDHFFCSRIQNYQQGDYENEVYKKKLVFEYYNPNLCGISIENFPYFWNAMKYSLLHPFYRSRIDKLKNHRPNILDDVLDYVKGNGKTTGKDLANLGKAHESYASWKSTRVSSSVLEYLWLMGNLAIVDRNHLFQKTYDTIERYVPKKFRFKENLNQEMFSFRRFLLKHKSYPVINMGSIKMKEKKPIFGKKKGFSHNWIEYEDFPSIAQLKGTNRGFLIPRNYEELLNQEVYDDHMRIVGVLDPIIWDRELTKFIFGFDYTWEVYKKEKDRIWGYYVLPLLYKGEFVGRLEGKLENNKSVDNKILKIFNIKLEKRKKFNKDEQQAFEDLIERWRIMTQADEVNFDRNI